MSAQGTWMYENIKALLCSY